MKKRKFILKRQALSFLFVVLFFCWTNAAQNESLTVANEKYLYHCENNEVFIDGYLGDETSLIMPSEIDGLPVTTISENAFNGADITNVVLPTGLRTIQSSAFDDSAIEEVVFPETLSEIGVAAFALTGFKHITIPESVTKIGEAAFASCYDLQTVEILSPLEILPESCFAEDMKLSKVILPAGLTTIGDRCFEDCFELKEINLPLSLLSIGNDAFSNCSSLESIVLPEGLETIGDACFMWCSSLSKMYIPSTLINNEWWDEFLFLECPNITLMICNNPAFEEYAKRYGIPYMIVENAESSSLANSVKISAQSCILTNSL